MYANKLTERCIWGLEVSSVLYFEGTPYIYRSFHNSIFKRQQVSQKMERYMEQYHTGIIKAQRLGLVFKIIL